MEGTTKLYCSFQKHAMAVMHGKRLVLCFAPMLLLVFALAMLVLPAHDAFAFEGDLRAGSLWDGPYEGYFADDQMQGGADGDTVRISGGDAAGANATRLLDGNRRSRAGYVIFPFIPNPTTDGFIKSIAEDARAIGQKDGLYASVMIAQAILESGSGSSGLSKPPYNNLFGIKGSYRGRSVSLWTSEDDGTGREYDIVAAFRRYPSARASLQDYADLLTRSMGAFYAPAWKVNARTYVQACNYLQGRYATDTTYAGKLRGIILAYDLTQYDHPAKKAGKGASKKEKQQKALELLQALSFDGAFVSSAAVLSYADKDESQASSQADVPAAASEAGQEGGFDPASAEGAPEGQQQLPVNPVIPGALALVAVGASAGVVAKGGGASIAALLKALFR